MTTPIENSPASQVSQDEVACVLGETHYEWSQPQDDPNQWHAVANDPRGCRCNLTARITQGGVEVSGLIVAWDFDLAAASESALLRFLGAAHDHVRLARFTLLDRRVNAVSFAAADRLDVELSDSVAAVVAACRLVWREVSALGDAAVAEAYLKTMQ
jgi:hypothetical protein